MSNLNVIEDRSYSSLNYGANFKQQLQLNKFDTQLLLKIGLTTLMETIQIPIKRKSYFSSITRISICYIYSRTPSQHP